VVWTRFFGSRYVGAPTGALASDGGIYLTGIVPVEGSLYLDGASLALRKYDEEGDELWVRELADPSFDLGAGFTVSVGGDGGVFLGGASVGTAESFSMRLPLIPSFVSTHQRAKKCGPIGSLSTRKPSIARVIFPPM